MNKKILISIIIVALVGISIGVYFILQKHEPRISRCGGGICGPVEKQKGICPADCENNNVSSDKKCSELNGNICSSSQTCSGSLLNASDSDKCCSKTCENEQQVNYEEKNRFGIYSATPNGENIKGAFSVLDELNIKEVSYLGRYSLDDAQLSGNFAKFDEFYQEALKKNINIVPWIRARAGSNCAQIDSSQMGDYFKKVIKKYPSIKYWKILKEPDKKCNNTPRMDSDNGISSPTSIAVAAKNTLNANCKDCNLVWGGFGPQVTKTYYDSLLKNNFYDNFDVNGLLGYHWEHLNYRPKTDNEEWIIQTSLPTNVLTEKEYAFETLKVFVYFFSLDFDRVYYDQIYDFGSPTDLFGSRGLITKENTKKEIFYTFRTMIDKLESFVSVTTISACNSPQGSKIEKGPTGNCQYKFNFKDKNPVYVLWCDSGNCSMPSEITGNVKVTDYLGNEETKSSSQITLNKTPIFVEEK